MLKRVLSAVLVLLPVFAVSAATPERQGPSYQACVQSQRPNGNWSKHYKVTGFIISGATLSEFARQHSYYSDYASANNYFIITWKRGGYTALDLGNADKVPVDNKIVKDQKRDDWHIRAGWERCR